MTVAAYVSWIVLCTVTACLGLASVWLYRTEIKDFFTWQTKRQPAIRDRKTTVDYLGALDIIDSYVASAMVGNRDAIKLSIRKDFIDKFDRHTGSKVSEYEYNAELLHQWMRSNAARLLVKNRADMS